MKLALIENHDELLKHRHVYAALGDTDEAERLVETLGFKGHDPDSNGPHPDAGVGEYEPRFWVFTDGTVRFEPLAPRWESGSTAVVVPDQGLLMTYGLVPRSTDDQVIHWDDPEQPRQDCVVAVSSISQMFGETGVAFVEVDATLIQDYSSLRGLSLVQVFYVECATAPSAELMALLAGGAFMDIQLPGRTVSLQLLRDEQILTRCLGIRLLMRPGAMPLTEGRSDYGQLNWPGIGPVARDDARMAGIGGHAEEVFVRDTVLAQFEGQPGFDIHPESGAVSYGNQWGVSWCQRYGRDLIQVDLKKLYEGNRPEIIRHYHAHSVDAPPLEARRWDEPNVATRARRIALAWADLGESLEVLAGALGLDSTREKLVGVSRSDLEYRSWWSDEEFDRIARHIPPAPNSATFVDRSAAIYLSTVDRFGERHIRLIVQAIGFDPEGTRALRSLKLLELIMKAARIATDTGLHLVVDRQEIVRRVGEQTEAPHISTLFKLNDLRQLDSHASGDFEARLNVILGDLGIDPMSAAGGYDNALDAIYDQVGDSLESLQRTLRDAFG